MLSSGKVCPHGIGSGHHSLGFQCFRFKGCGHFRQNHPYQIGLQILLHYHIPRPDRHLIPAGRFQDDGFWNRFPGLFLPHLQQRSAKPQQKARNHHTHEHRNTDFLPHTFHFHPSRNYGSTSPGKGMSKPGRDIRRKHKRRTVDPIRNNSIRITGDIVDNTLTL